MNTMLKRAAATQACMDRFAYKPVEPGVRDCGKLAAHALHKQGRSAKLLNASKHRSWRGALAYLKRTGFASLVELIDAMELQRIPPAAALPGDIIAMPTDEANGFGCSLAVALENGRVLGLNPATNLIEPMIPHLFVCAWRV
ncbi:DUF6950 family protein [Brevundimonas sp. Marseille-Q4549]|jgi:hypothetical protein